LLDDFEDILKSGKNLKNFFKDIANDIQKLAINDVKQWLSIEIYITVLDVLQDILAKAKQSFDEVMTFKIGILKILGKNNTPSSQPSPQDTSILNSFPSQGKEATTTEASSLSSQERVGERWQKEDSDEEIKKVPKQEETSLLDEVQDIFAGESSFEEHPFKDLGGQMTPDQGFDTSKLIDEVKKLGAKAAVTMSLKWSAFNVHEHELRVWTKTKIARSTLDKPENKEMLLEACQNMWMSTNVVQIS